MSKNYCKVEHKWCKLCKKSDNGMCCVFQKNYIQILKNIHKCPKRECKETISLRNLFKKVNFYDVMTAMLKSHPKEKRNVLGYAKAYIDIVQKKGIKSNGMIRCIKETFLMVHALVYMVYLIIKNMQ